MRANIRRACHHRGVDPNTGVAVVFYSPTRKQYVMWAVRSDELRGIGALEKAKRLGVPNPKLIAIRPLLETGEFVEIDARVS